MALNARNLMRPRWNDAGKGRAMVRDVGCRPRCHFVHAWNQVRWLGSGNARSEVAVRLVSKACQTPLEWFARTECRCRSSAAVIRHSASSECLFELSHSPGGDVACCPLSASELS